MSTKHITALRRWRGAQALTQKELGDLFGVSQQAIRKWEIGKVPVERIADVMKVTGLSANDLYPGLLPEGYCCERKPAREGSAA